MVFSSDTIILVKDSIYSIPLSEPSVTICVKGEEIISFIENFPSPVSETLKCGVWLFGFVLGWNLYYINRFQKRGSQTISDYVSLVGALGGGGILALFEVGSELFAYYAIGLAAGFFAYFGILLLLVFLAKVANWDVAKWLLDPGDGTSPFSISIEPTFKS